MSPSAKDDDTKVLTGETDDAHAASSLSAACTLDAVAADDQEPLFSAAWLGDTGRKVQASWPASLMRSSLAVAMSLGLLLATCGTLTAAIGYMRTPQDHEPTVTVYDGPNLEDIRELLTVVKQIYPDGEPFKHLKMLDVDDSDPNNIKFELKKSRFPNSTAERSLIDKPTMKNLNLAVCGIDAAQSAITVGQLVTNIKSAAEACVSPYPKDGSQQDFCAQMVSLNIALWGFLACYIEDMVSSCENSFNANAVCALDVTGLVTNGAMVAEGASGAKGNCQPPKGFQTTTEVPDGFGGLSKSEVKSLNNAFDTMEDLKGAQDEQDLAAWSGPGWGARRLNADEPRTELSRRLDENPNVEAKQWKQAACGLDTTKAAARLAQFGVLIAKADQDCSTKNFIKNGQAGKNLCAVDITGAMASAGIAASLITVSVVNCPAALEFTKKMGQQFCAASIIDLVTAATYMSTSIADIDTTCGMLTEYKGPKLRQQEAKVRSFRIS